ncbi:unnamed protein product [Absidia cylindrospora]
MVEKGGSKHETRCKLSTAADKSVFGLPLLQSIQYAYSTITYHDNVTNTPCMAIIPTIIAKCGSYLKEEGLEIEGIFRLSGSSKRIGQLQALFDTPDTQYGVYLAWDDYNVHDVANVMRRFLNHLPEPVIPLNHHQVFRSTLETDFDSTDAKIQAFQNLINQIPLVNQFLLLYLLDLLSLFSMTKHLTRMDISSLASVFAPGILSHPDDALNPLGYKESQLVVEYLIEHQDKFSMPRSRIPYVKSDCIVRPPLQAPPMQHSLSLPADIPFTDNDIHPLYSGTHPSSSLSRPAFLDTKSMTSLPLPTVSSSSPSSSSSSFYANPTSSKSMVQVGQLPAAPVTPSSSSSKGIRRNKTLPSKNSKSTSSSETIPPPPPSSASTFYLPNSNNSSTSTFSKPAWLDRSNSTSGIMRRERQHSMPMANQKTPVRRWKSIRTVPPTTLDHDAPISTQ